MSANAVTEETTLIDGAVSWLAASLPSNWSVQRSSRELVGSSNEAPVRVDAVIDVRGPNGGAAFAVEAKQSFSPRDVEKLLPHLTRVLRTLAGNAPVLVVAPWLSRRTQELLRQEGINYIDLTGNALVRLDYPTLYLKTAGATRNPDPEPRGIARVRGPKAARLIRLLADVRPPYGVRKVADAAQLAPGYVSRLLDALDREALIDRSRRGDVELVDVAALLRRWAESYDVLKNNDVHRFIAPEGATKAADQLGREAGTFRAAVTGSFAAVRRAPVAAPALLLAYVEDVSQAADALNLLPAQDGADVVLARPFDRVVWQRTSTDDGLTCVAPSQAAVDCLTGTGRMPAEGEALLAWMIAHEPQWRLGSLQELAQSGREP